MSNSAISNAVKSCIKKAYIAQKLPIPGGITAHSTRRAANNAAFNKNASVEEVYRAAMWSSLSTVMRDYKRNIYNSADGAFGRRVFKNVLDYNDGLPPDS